MTAPYVHESSYADEGVAIGDDTKVWHFCHIQSGASIGRGCSLGQNVYVGANAKIGDGVKIQKQRLGLRRSGVGGPRVLRPLLRVHERSDAEGEIPQGRRWVQEDGRPPRRVDRGERDDRLRPRNRRVAMVGSGAVVTSDVPPHALVLGVPARQRGWACECGAVLSEDLACSDCGRTYAQSDEGLKEVQHGVS